MGGKADRGDNFVLPCIPEWEHSVSVAVREGGRRWHMNVDGGEAVCVAQDGSSVRLPCRGVDGFVSAYIRLLEIARGKRGDSQFCYDWRSAC
ncbi:MAG: hypothetical protein J6Y93_05130 [Treponema sp.]|nr:hypothetical protein [Treponema sp.]